MKIFYYSIVFFLTALNLSAQNTNSTCAEGNRKAKEDFKNGKYVLEALGQIVDEEFYPFYIDFAKKKYNIKLTYYDCVRFPYTDCYHKQMKESLYKKFGDSLEIKMKEEALTAFKKSAPYRTRIQPKIEADSLFIHIHTVAKFSEDELAMKAFLRDNIRETTTSYWSQTVSFIVEKDGALTNITFQKTPKEEVKTEVLRLMDLMPKWIPATYYGEKVRSKKSISIASKKEIEMMDRIRKKKEMKKP